MELLSGMTLARRIDGKALGTDELLRWAIQIADALDATHASGIVHRDIKPGNVFVTTRGDAKILDFGIARIAMAAQPIDPESQTATAPELLTSQGVTPGTLAYMSPEQALGKPLDARNGSLLARDRALRDVDGQAALRRRFGGGRLEPDPQRVAVVAAPL